MDAKTPCIAEAARRLLRTDGTSLIVPEDLIDEALQLSLAISDGIPSLKREPTVSIGPSDRIEVEGLSLIGGEEPSTTICWIPIATETLHSLCQSLGIETGIQSKSLIQAAEFIQNTVEKESITHA